MNLNASEAGRLADVLLGELEELGGRLAPGPFGRYRITRLIGVGGMGEVYEAEQENPARRVAIKVVRPELISPGALKRFEHETRMLARLQHPGIAPIYEAGQVESDGGRTPFFAMEYVEGRPLTEFAASQKLGVRARLELFLRVCEAVEHAHQRGVIHRDLKPGNVLVDAAGRPRVMDFGVARATDSDVQATSIATEVGRLVGTLPYMSPEQVGGDAEELDTRSDVYSLGVVLYELLGSKLPYDVKGSGGGRIAEAVRAIRESEPAPLSSVDRVFRGDLETIVGRALEKERGRRYQSVGELAADVRRYLADEPIVARRPSTWYQVRKFARRNRGVAWMFAALIGAMAIGTMVSTKLAFAEAGARKNAEASAAAAKRAQHEVEAHQTSLERERNEAIRQAAIAGETTKFLQQLLASAKPEEMGRDVKVLDLLHSARDQIDQTMGHEPAIAAALHNTLGEAYWSLGDLPSARSEFQRALDMRKAHFGIDHAETVTAATNLATALVDMGKLPEAGSHYEFAYARRDLLADSPLSLTGLLSNYGAYLQDVGRMPESVAVLADALRRAKAAFGDDDVRTLSIQGNMLAGLMDEERYLEAEPQFRDLLARRSQVLGPRHPSTLSARHNLGMALYRLDRWKEATPELTLTLEARREVLGPAHIATLTTADGLAGSLESDGRHLEALPVRRQCLADAESGLNPDHPALAKFRLKLGACLVRLGRYQEAEPHLLASYQHIRSLAGDGDDRTAAVREEIARMYLAWGRPESAAGFRPAESSPPRSP